VQPQRRDQLFHVVADDGVHVDQLRIRVRESRVRVLEAEEDGGAANERLKVAPGEMQWWKEAAEHRHQVSLAASPFDDRAHAYTLW
jgi:hypothetical protein